jgi:hypothetical protein
MAVKCGGGVYIRSLCSHDLSSYRKESFYRGAGGGHGKISVNIDELTGPSKDIVERAPSTT